ncbi:MAG: hypothetical protein KJN71_08250 [Acidimicrobiia bacterium]|nr:hypothetical protein [Acidimicrobiia bacterium]NNC74343.1 hypothetical protein [Acidimicrobiia bacterium]
MKRLLASLILGVALVAAFPAVAGATNIALQSEPAVEVEIVEEAEEEQPWTARFLAPLFVVIAILSIVASIVIYLGRVKRRYTVAE